MYQPILKNKLNELKGLDYVSLDKSLNPIIELVDLNKKSTAEDIIKYLLEKIPKISKNKNIYIDTPTYLYNELYDYLELGDIENKHNLFLKIKEIFHKNIDFTPVISFDYYYESEKKSYKENIKFFKKMMNDFDKLAIRIFANETFSSSDEILLSQIYDFLGDELENKHITLIIEVSKKNKLEIFDLLKEITKEYKINQITLVGEAFNNDSRHSTKEVYDRIKNHHLINFLEIQKSFNSNFVYADYTLVDKIPNKIEIDPEKGFLYYPFIKFTTEDGNMCYFSAESKGKYEQYKDLCTSIIKKITNYSLDHCSTCKFIKDVSNGTEYKFRSGGTWKYRMIAHHISTMADYFK
ncbi:beta family protein [Aliarcobacter butzleri]|uniref:beta family protein n=1 Tax=Aliarcobacter butzleri TaxID=28197 RepID=UPI001EDBC82D|nr:beta family protein [Aliarcobacter butzleri]MCG3662543.1 beta family protein [Aliarcobacter butzleri]